MEGHQSTMITPESIIEIPKFEGPWPDSSGRRFLYIERKFCSDTHITTAKLSLLHVQSDVIQILREGPQIQSAFWAEGSNYIVLFESTKAGNSKISVLCLDNDDAPVSFALAGTLPGEVSGLGGVAISDQKITLAFSAMAASNGEIYNANDAPHSWSSGREYTRMPVRTSNAWITSEKLSVFCTILDFSGGSPCIGELFNTLSETDQEHKTFGGIHLTKHGIAVVAGAHLPNISEIPLAEVYYIPMAAVVQHDLSARQRLQTPGFNGFSNSPQISKDGERLIYLQKKISWLEDDTSLLVICEGLKSQNRKLRFSIHELRREDGSSKMLLSPLRVCFTADETSVFLISEDRAELRLFRASLSAGDSLIAKPLTKGWSIDALHVLPGSVTSIFVAGSTINLSRRWMILDTESLTLSPIKEGTQEENDLKLDKTTFESIEWPGADNVPVQAWLVKPRDFDSNKQYPLLYCIHGGPNAAFNNSWASGYWRNWNFILLAEQGFIVVAPNASGSSGFGAEYAKRVVNDWGGKSYIDHVKGFAYLQAELRYVDTDRAIALGTSFGGFMVNWIQGQSLGRQFKALVSECGFMNTSTQYTSDLIWFEDHLGGPMYKSRNGYDKFNPINHIENWSTPALIISNELDYRVPILEGLAAFQILQAKGVESRFLSFSDEVSYYIEIVRSAPSS
ncbi:uncharacterized protein N7511_002180 [Penicillium nucicola]|uniref:uncharacterized protein n=1 Tax=Penicillium nucicola TaxID=1850975 RepID=UPI002545472B|nr:uncharacterized protein N7511_002180 [Penicillium nucicola]KAJ5770129.1 hypothetical protein N7511_002180 [Penicillium nucicola]